MAKRGKFDLLIKLAEDRLDAAALRMKQAQQAQQQAESTLQQVDAFVADYQQRVLGMAQRGLGIDQWKDARLFLAKLDDAKVQQQNELERCLQRFLLEKQAWLAQRKQLKSYQVLQERETLRLAQRQQKTEQKQMDEFAARISGENKD